MRTLTNLIDRLPIDNKLIATVVTFALTRGALELGIPIDPTLEAVIAGTAAAVAGYVTPNEGTILRRAEGEDGNPHDLEPDPPNLDRELYDEAF